MERKKTKNAEPGKGLGRPGPGRSRPPPVKPMIIRPLTKTSYRANVQGGKWSDRTPGRKGLPAQKTIDVEGSTSMAKESDSQPARPAEAGPPQPPHGECR